jgi:hypothetical protein
MHLSTSLHRAALVVGSVALLVALSGAGIATAGRPKPSSSRTETARSGQVSRTCCRWQPRADDHP